MFFGLINIKTSYVNEQKSVFLKLYMAGRKAVVDVNVVDVNGLL